MSDNAKETSNRAELRDRIIVKATEAFTAHGIKSITMDDIATSLGIYGGKNEACQYVVGLKMGDCFGFQSVMVE